MEDAIALVRSDVEDATKERRYVSITQLGQLTYNSRGVFFNAICEITSVLVPNHQASPLTILRVCDGTCHAFKGQKPVYRLDDAEIGEASVRDVGMETSLCTLDIACYDEYSEKAKAFEPGDIVLINNLRAAEKQSMVAINLHGDGTQGKRFNRGITALGKAKQKPWEKPRLDMEVRIIPEDSNPDEIYAQMIGDATEANREKRTQFYEEESDPGDNSFDLAGNDN